MSARENRQAEEAVVCAALRDPSMVAEVTANAALDEGDFRSPDLRLLWAQLVESFYGDDPTDPLSIAALTARRLGAVWGTSEEDTVARVQEMAARPSSGHAVPAAKLVRRYAARRGLLDLAKKIEAECSGDADPEVIAADIAQVATSVASNSKAKDLEVLSFADAGREFLRELEFRRDAHKHGYEVGVKTGITAIDRFTAGLQPTELMLAAGEPGVGKTGVYMRAAFNFACEQAKRPPDQRVGTLFLSLEMGNWPSSARIAQMLTGARSEEIRDGSIGDRSVDALTREWAGLKDLPLWFNYSPRLRASQMRTVVAEAIRRHNVGFVVIDHFSMFQLDQRLRNRNDEDEEKVLFLKQDLAAALNVAVVCLAHTRKTDDPAGRPHLGDLRGSQMISAIADFVNFLYRPYRYATEDQIDAGHVLETDAELIWAKNRHNKDGIGSLYFDPEMMVVR